MLVPMEIRVADVRGAALRWMTALMKRLLGPGMMKTGTRKTSVVTRPSYMPVWVYVGLGSALVLHSTW